MGQYTVIALSIKDVEEETCEKALNGQSARLQKEARRHDYYGKMVGHIRAMFSHALKTNPFLEFAILSGCLRIVRGSIFTGINYFS